MVTAQEYSEVLRKENILIKARNFLVFQGDVEAIASQSADDLTKLIEQISGSVEYKKEYDQLKDELEKARSASSYAFSKKKKYDAEKNTYRAQRDIVEKFQQIVKQRVRILKITGICV